MTSRSTSFVLTAGSTTGAKSESTSVTASESETNDCQPHFEQHPGCSVETARRVYLQDSHVLWKNDGRLAIDIIAYIPINGVDRAEYYDYVHKVYRLDDIKCDLANGNMPPGLVLCDQYGVMAYVARDRRHLERLVLK